MKEKVLKILPEFFEEVASGNKRAELRLNDRDFKVGDIYKLSEWKGKKFTGRTVKIRITHILQGFEGLKEGWCMFSFKTIDEISDEDMKACAVSIDYEAEYYRCIGTMANIHNEREEAKSAILAMSTIINEQKTKIADLEKKIEDDYWRRLHNGK